MTSLTSLPMVVFGLKDSGDRIATPISTIKRVVEISKDGKTSTIIVKDDVNVEVREPFAEVVGRIHRVAGCWQHNCALPADKPSKTEEDLAAIARVQVLASETLSKEYMVGINSLVAVLKQIISEQGE